jgi:hypothetical protein
MWSRLPLLRDRSRQFRRADSNEDCTKSLWCHGLSRNSRLVTSWLVTLQSPQW